MHPQIEKLEQLFSQAKKNPAVFTAFFEQLWIPADALPHAELKSLVKEVVDWTRSQNPVPPDILAMSTLSFGLTEYFEGSFELCHKTGEQAWKLFEQIDDKDGVAAVMMMMGSNYRSLGELELALKSLLEGCQILAKTNRYQAFRSYGLYMLGGIYAETKQYDEALLDFGECEKVVMNLGKGNENMLSRIYNGIGVVYQCQKRYALALEYLNRSLKLTEEINSLPVKARALTDLGSYYFEMGDYVAASEYQQRALKIRTEENIQSGAVTNMLLLAEIARKAERPDEAIEWLTKALPIADELRVKQKMFQIHCLLSELYQVKGEMIKSLFHYKAYHNIREEVQHEDSEKKIKNLQKVFEAEQTMKENTIIKAQKVEIEHKNEQLSETIHELTITKVNRKAKALAFIVGIILIVAQDPLFDLVLKSIGENHYWISLGAKVVIILSLKPLELGIEKYLLRRIILKKRNAVKMVLK